MIIIYPMLYTSGISENALPGICTILEAYLLTYHQTEILANPFLVNNKNRKVNYKIDSRGRITGKVNESYILEARPLPPGATGTGHKTPTGGGGGKTHEDLSDEMSTGFDGVKKDADARHAEIQKQADDIYSKTEKQFDRLSDEVKTEFSIAKKDLDDKDVVTRKQLDAIEKDAMDLLVQSKDIVHTQDEIIKNTKEIYAAEKEILDRQKTSEVQQAAYQAALVKTTDEINTKADDLKTGQAVASTVLSDVQTDVKTILANSSKSRTLSTKEEQELDEKIKNLENRNRTHNTELALKGREYLIKKGEMELKEKDLALRQGADKRDAVTQAVNRGFQAADQIRKNKELTIKQDSAVIEKAKEERDKKRSEREIELHKFKKIKDEAEAGIKKIEYARMKKEEAETLKDKIKKASVKIEEVNSRTITLEPSTVTVALEMPNKQIRREMIGVKIVPMRIKSDVKMAHILASDVQMNFIMRLVTVAGRSILKKAWSIFDRMLRAISFGSYKQYGGVTTTGDPRKDIILGRTGHKGETFIAIEKSTDFDNEIFTDPMKIKNLFIMGWGNLIITDNVSKQAHFCMKKYRGMCNTLPFLMLYETLKASKSYETLEDIKKQTQSLFKTKPIRIEKILSEAKALNKLSQYRSLREGK